MTYRSETDVRTRVFGCRFFVGGDSQRDYVEHFDRLDDLSTKRRHEGGDHFAMLVVFDPGYPLPDARTRQRAAQVSAAPGFDHYIGIVSDSPLARGVLTAMSWLRPQQHVHDVFLRASDAVAWLESRRGGPLPSLRDIERRLSMLGIAR